MTMNWYKPMKTCTACKEGNNSDYQPNYEDISDTEIVILLLLKANSG